MPVIVAVTVGVAVLGVVVAIVQAHRRILAREAEELAQLGFQPCPEEEPRLAELVAFVENNAEYTYRVRGARRAQVGGAAVYAFRKTRRRGGNTTVTRDMLFPLRRPTADGLFLYVVPARTASHPFMRQATDLLMMQWDVHADDLVRLDAPEELAQHGLLGALGPRGASITDLAEPEQFAAFLRAGQIGAHAIHCRGEWCDFSSLARGTPFDAAGLLEIITELVNAKRT